MTAPIQRLYPSSAPLKWSIEVIKESVPVETYAAEYTDLRPSGMRLVGHCPAPDHADPDPSFHIWPEGQSWWCFGCSRGTDIFDLYKVIEGEDELWVAIKGLAERYSIELPKRSQRWADWEDEKFKRRQILRRTLTRSYQRRYLRLFREYLQDIQNPLEREQEAQAIHADLYHLSLRSALQREES